MEIGQIKIDRTVIEYTQSIYASISSVEEKCSNLYSYMQTVESKFQGKTSEAFNKNVYDMILREQSNLEFVRGMVKAFLMYCDGMSNVDTQLASIIRRKAVLTIELPEVPVFEESSTGR